MTTPLEHVAPLLAAIESKPKPTALAECAAWHERQRDLNERSEAVAIAKNNISDAGIYGARAAMHSRFAAACREADEN